LKGVMLHEITYLRILPEDGGLLRPIIGF
jgi:hypothetical protein